MEPWNGHIKWAQNSHQIIKSRMNPEWIQNESSKTCPEKLLKRSIHWCKLTKSKFHWKHAFFLRSWNCWSPLWASLRRNDWDICAELSEIAWAGLEGCGKKQMWKRTARKQKSCSEFCMMYDYKLWNVQTILWSFTTGILQGCGLVSQCKDLWFRERTIALL